MRPAHPDAPPLHELPVSEAALRLREGSLSAEVYAAALLQRCHAHASLNAFIRIDDDAVLDAARAADRHRAEGRPLGRLHGVPLALKDNIPSERVPTTGGTAALAGASGVGYFIVQSQYAMQPAPMYAAVVCLSLVGYVLNRAVVALEKSALPWHGAS